ncbi:MAG: hypothetical protein WCB85_14885 [Candidatus Dormiibacterota bacterium]
MRAKTRLNRWTRLAMVYDNGMLRLFRRADLRPKHHPAPALRPVCPICERPMERRASTVWLCPDFPRCPGSVAAD